MIQRLAAEKERRERLGVQIGARVGDVVAVTVDGWSVTRTREEIVEHCLSISHAVADAAEGDQSALLIGLWMAWARDAASEAARLAYMEGEERATLDGMKP